MDRTSSRSCPTVGSVNHGSTFRELAFS